ncbi:MAG TPA: MFS transporter [Dehalococcoidia bacterium]|nr:MFS transporter [Dehalococcoidia bacterium]
MQPDATIVAAGPTSSAVVAVAPRPRLWSVSLALLFGVVHLYFLSFALYFAALPLYVKGAPRWQIGLVVGVPFIASMLLRLHTGRIVDRLGRRRLLAAGAAGCALASLLQAVSADVWYLSAVRALYGITAAFLTTAIMASLADVLPAPRRGEGMGWYGVVYTSTSLYGPALGLWLAQAFGYGAFFGAGVLLNLGCLGLALLLPETQTAQHRAAPRGKLFSPSARLTMLTFLSLTIPAGAVTAFLALYEKQRHAGDPGVFFALYGVTLLLGRIGGGWVADRWSRRAAIVPGLLVTGGAMLLLSAAHSAAAFYLAALLYGAGFAFGHTGLTILTMDRAPEAERGAAMATLTGAWDVGTVLGAFVLGFLADAGGYAALFALVGLLPPAQLVVFLVCLRRDRRAAPESGDRFLVTGYR